jgi:uroporphyrinogen decarboxylase
MTNRERVHAILAYQDYDRMPIVDFGFNDNALQEWYRQGHLDDEDMIQRRDGGAGEKRIERKLGFDFNWQGGLQPMLNTGLMPHFERRVIERFPDGIQHIVTNNGSIVGIKEGISSIPQDVGTLLADRKAWEALFLPKLQYSTERIKRLVDSNTPKSVSGLENPRGLHCGSLYGVIRDIVGVSELAYLYADDEALYYEIIDTKANLCHDITKAVLELGYEYDYGHFWEDICFKNGPLINPELFDQRIGPHYKRITGVLRAHGVAFVSLDCDGFIDHLVPTWLNNGVNVMFPLEVGTWNANLADMRAKFGKGLLAVGGMDKRILTEPKNYAAIDREVERLYRMADLGGYIPCPDHRMPPDAKWENVQHYCEQMKKVFWRC